MLSLIWPMIGPMARTISAARPDVSMLMEPDVCPLISSPFVGGCVANIAVLAVRFNHNHREGMAMAKFVVLNEKDPDIGIVLEEVPMGTPGQGQGWRGRCTQCGWPMHRWNMEVAVRSAQGHVDGHEAAL
jgi:hypothetical protein